MIGLVGVARLGCVVVAGGAALGVRGFRDVWSGSYSGAGYPKTLFRRTSAV